MGRHHDNRHADARQLVSELGDRTTRQLADCIEFLELNLRAQSADDGGPVECVHGTELLTRLGPSLFGVVTFYTGMTMHLLDEIRIMHRSIGSPGGETIIDDTLAAARHAAARQIDATESVLRAHVDERLGGQS